MPSVCLYFQVHQPLRIKKYRIFDVGVDDNYFNDGSDSNLNNRKILEKVANKSYFPTNALLLKLLQKHPQFKLSFSISGILLKQAENFLPALLDSFKKLVDTGRVEILSETSHHSLSFIYSPAEFRRQVQIHRKKIKELFNYEPKVFRNTELIFNNNLAYEIEGLGYEGILTEGADHILGWRSPNFLYRPKGTKKIKALLKNYRLSDDIAFRFSCRDWSEYPLTAAKFANWITAINGSGEIVNLFLDYETFGEHQWSETGIFEFLEHLPNEILANPDNNFVTPSESVLKFEPKGEIDVPEFISWADMERDLSAWTSNPMQADALKKLYELENLLYELDDPKLLEDWRRLTTSDHFYYMCTKYFADGDVHKYFNPYETPYEAFIAYMNVLTDLKLRAQNKAAAKKAQVQKFYQETKHA